MAALILQWGTFMHLPYNQYGESRPTALYKRFIFVILRNEGSGGACNL
jgi:hypothetical protein